MKGARQTVIRLLGEITRDAASCPHCGASGRHVAYFVTSDGKQRGAMRGCFRDAFSVDPLAVLLEQWERRLADYPGWRKAEAQIETLHRLIEKVYGVDVSAFRRVSAFPPKRKGVRA